MATLIPDQNKSINANFRHGNNGRDNFRVGYVGEVVEYTLAILLILIMVNYLLEQKILIFLLNTKIMEYQNLLMQ